MKQWNRSASDNPQETMGMPWPARSFPTSSNTELTESIDERNGLAHAAIEELRLAHEDLLWALETLSGCPDHEFPAHYKLLVSEFERTFRREEQWMDDIDCSDMHAHREEHARVLCALHKVHSAVMLGNLNEGRRVADELLPQWFSLHAATLDAELRRALQRAGDGHRMPPRC